MIIYYDNSTGDPVETVNENHYHSWLKTERKILRIVKARKYWGNGEYFEAYAHCPYILDVLEDAEYIPEDVFLAMGQMHYASGLERVKNSWGGYSFI